MAAGAVDGTGTHAFNNNDTVTNNTTDLIASSRKRRLPFGLATDTDT